MSITVSNERSEIEEIADGIYCLKARIPGLHTDFSIYIIKEGGGALIEPGPAALIPDIRAGVRRLGMKDLAYIIPTHIHLDHGGAAGGLASVFTGAQVVVHPRGRQHLVDPSRLIKSTRTVYGPDFEATYGVIEPVPEAQVRVVADGEKLSLDSRSLMVVHTPGHAPHHFSVLDERSRSLFPGEALGLIYQPGIEPLPAMAPPGFMLEKYLDNMEKLRRLKPRRLIYSHGGVDEEVDAAVTAAARNTRLIADVILNALRAGEKEKAVIGITRDYLRERFNAGLAEPDLEANVNGLIYYYKKKGLA